MEKLYKWKQEKGLTKPVFSIMLEAWRRQNKFHKNGSNKQIMVSLVYPSEAKEVVKMGLIKPYSKVIPRKLNWYNVTDEGQKIIDSIPVEWDEKKYNQPIFDAFG